jgi:cobalt-zinc-cadmium efflux system membrane fusion protein
VALGALVFALVGCDNGSGEHPGDGGAVATPAAAHEHPADVEACFICEPSLRDAGRLWCREHDRYEDRCWECHPELRDATRLYCEEHGLYEDECFLCDPSRAGGAREPGEEEGEAGAAAVGALGATPTLAAIPAGDGLHCLEHDLAEVECAICHPDLAASLDAGESMKIRFASAEGPRKAGVRTAPARVAESAGTVEALAESQLNGNRMARITPLAHGVVQRVLVDVGDSVEEGDALLEIHSAEVANAKADFLTSLVLLEVAEDTLRRESALREQNISAEQDYLAADATYRRARIEATTARQRLLNLGMTEAEVDAIAASEDGSATIVLRAPFTGEIVSRASVVGEAVSPGSHLLTVADRSTMWVELSVDADASSRLQIGNAVAARFDALPGVTVGARLTWIDASIDPRSRLLRARAVVERPDPRLRAGLYGAADIVVSARSEVVRVPRDAVQHVSGQPFVFVRAGDDLFEARRVSLAGLSDSEADVLSGLAPGEPVVVTGAFTVMSEMLKARLGAGCVH